MPALPNVPKTVRIDWRFVSNPNNNIFTRSYLTYAGTVNAGDGQTWLTTLFTAYGARWANHMSSAVNLVAATLTDLDSSSGIQVTHAGAVAGGVGNAVVNNATCVVVEWETLRRFRGGHPRTYFPGGPASLTFDTETWTAAATANWLTDFNGWVADAAAAGPGAVGAAHLSAVSYYAGFTTVNRLPLRARNVNTVRAVPIVDQVLNAEVNPRQGTQRRRLQRP